MPSELEGQRIVDAIPAQVWIASPDGAITYVNKQRLDYTGMPVEQALGWGWSTGDVFHPEDLPGLMDAWRWMLAAGEPGETEVRVRRFDGAYRWFLIRAVPSRDARGAIVEWFGTNTDIHERKLAEGRLQRSEHEYRQIVDAIPLLITAMDPGGSALYVNRSLLDYSGLAAGEFADDARLFHPDDLTRVLDERARGLAAGVPFGQEARVRRHDGTHRWFLIHHRPVFDDAGQIQRWYATGTDIDERRRDEQRIRNENVILREEVDRASMFEEIVGTSAPLKAILRQVAQVAPTDSTVLITGETGTGKELVARAIHRRSARAGQAFVTINCAAIPTSLIASELFGHERGAFTGALQRRQGKFELADGGTIFLDEVGELPPDTQVALLRVLQERQVERVGGDRSIPVDVRVIAATNRDLRGAVADKSFRSDLFYRLHVFPIHMPALRERTGDVRLLVEYFAHRFATRTGRPLLSVGSRTLGLLQAYSWPGNVRELQNIIERALIVSESDALVVEDHWLLETGVAPPGAATPAAAPSPAAPLSDALATHERAQVEAALAEARGQVSGPLGAAARLGVPRSTLESKIRSLGIDKHRFKLRTSS